MLQAWTGLLFGAPVDRLRVLVARDYSPRHFLLTDSGTSALALAISACAREPGRAPVVALPAYGCYDLATAADAAGARVVLYDVDPATLGPEWSSFSAALRAGVDAVVVVHQYGIPVDMDRVESEVRDAGVVVIEDAAQAVGARHGGRPAGTIAALSVLSFGRGKGRTGGNGGALLVHDDRLVPLVKRLRVGPSSRGLREALLVTMQWLLARPGIYGVLTRIPQLGLGETVYRQPRRAAGISRAAAACLSTIWTGAERETSARRRHAEEYRLGPVQSTPISLIAPPAQGEPGWLRFPVVAHGAEGWLAGARAKSLGIMPGYPRALPDLPGFDRVQNRSDAFPGARELARLLMTLPTHGRLAATDRDRILELIRSFAA